MHTGTVESRISWRVLMSLSLCCHTQGSSLGTACRSAWSCDLWVNELVCESEMSILYKCLSKSQAATRTIILFPTAIAEGAAGKGEVLQPAGLLT